MRVDVIKHERSLRLVAICAMNSFSEKIKKETKNIEHDGQILYVTDKGFITHKSRI